MVRLLDENVSADELAILDRVEANRRQPGRVQALPVRSNGQRTWWALPIWKLAAACIITIMIVTAAWTFLPRGSSQQGAGGPTSERTLEARLSDAPYEKFTHTRAGSAPGNPATGNDDLARLGADDREIGRYYLRRHDFDNASRHLENAERKQPRSIDVCNDLGVAYLESGSDATLQKAAKEFRDALNLDPQYAPALFNLAVTYERMGNFADAERQLRRYIEIDPDSGWAKEVQSKLELLKR